MGVVRAINGSNLLDGQEGRKEPASHYLPYNQSGMTAMMRKIAVYSVLAVGVLMVGLMVFYPSLLSQGHDKLMARWPELTWVKVVSVTILIVGCFYAVIERSILIAIVTLLAAGVLPWLDQWVRHYWPLFKQYYF